MKLFWAIISVFAVAAVVVVFSQRGNGTASTSTPTQNPGNDDQAMRGESSTPSRSTPQSPSDLQPQQPFSSSGLFDEPEEPTDTTRTPVSTPDAGSSDGVNVTPPLDDADELANELVDDLLADQDESFAQPMPSSPGGAGDHQHQPIQTAENPWAVEGELPLGDERMAAQRLQHSVIEQDDGSLLLDETFVIRGQGTRESPYEITWDLLMSAAETYQPRLGMENIPERVAMLDGKYVKISGHLMFPMVTAQADELLVMLNMWDGCCIGTMPSPYDAIEVQLGTPAATGGNQQFFNYGTIEGTLLIDPYLINDWLIGLYLMEDAKLKVGM